MRILHRCMYTCISIYIAIISFSIIQMKHRLHDHLTSSLKQFVTKMTDGPYSEAMKNEWAVLLDRFNLYVEAIKGFR